MVQDMCVWCDTNCGYCVGTTPAVYRKQQRLCHHGYPDGVLRFLNLQTPGWNPHKGHIYISKFSIIVQFFLMVTRQG